MHIYILHLNTFTLHVGEPEKKQTACCGTNTNDLPVRIITPTVRPSIKPSGKYVNTNLIIHHWPVMMFVKVGIAPLVLMSWTLTCI